MPRLTCYRVRDDAPTIVPARSERDWMDASDERFAYRCLPLTIANSMGWEMLLSTGIVAEWNGGPEIGDLRVEGLDGADTADLAVSHFGRGVLTFQTGYLFRTDPSVGLCVRGVPNRPKDGIAPLEGVVETDWLPFTFTMNWMFTRPGRVVFEAGEPFGFITPLNYRYAETFRPEILPIEQDPVVAEAYAEYRALRLDFIKQLKDNNPEAVQQSWQKWYFRGTNSRGEPGNPLHLSRIRMADPVLRSETPQDSDVPEAVGDLPS